MILTHKEARRVLGGRKVQHRLPFSSRCPEIGSLIPVSYKRSNPAMGYTRMGDYRQEVVRACEVRILSYRMAMLEDATGDDARAEGYTGRAELLAAWAGSPKSWVVRFEAILTPKPRFLSREVVAGRQGGYTDTPLRGLEDEPEAVDEATQERFSDLGRERDQDHSSKRRRALGALPVGAQVVALENEAKARHVDVRSELRAVRRFGREAQLEALRSAVDIG